MDSSMSRPARERTGPQAVDASYRSAGTPSSPGSALSTAHETGLGFHPDPKARTFGRMGYVLLQASRGPQGVVLPLWTAAVIAIACVDSVCGGFQGHGSGRDGELCTVDAEWNETLWIDSGGASCIKEGAFGLKYTHDQSLSGCANALEAYRASTGYTCNCTGDYAYLETLGGMRATAVPQVQYTADLLILAGFLPWLGTVTDFTQNRRLLLYAMQSVVILAIVVKGGALAPNNVWLISLVSFAVIHIFVEGIDVIQKTFVPDVCEDEASVGGMMAAAYSLAYVGMVAAAIFVVVISRAGFGSAMTTQLTIFGGAVWATVGFVAISFFQNRPARRTLETKESLARVTFRELVLVGKELVIEYPECAKYFFALCLANNGTATFGLVYATYFSVQMKLEATDLMVISGLVVCVAALATAVFSQATHLVRLHQVLIVDLFLLGVSMAMIPFFVYRPGDHYRAYAMSVQMGITLGLYFTCQFGALVQLLPKHKMGKYTGLFPALKNVANAFGPMIYAGIAQTYNDQRLAISLAITPFIFLSLIPLMMTDFAGGARQVQEEEARLEQELGENWKELAEKAERSNSLSSSRMSSLGMVGSIKGKVIEIGAAAKPDEHASNGVANGNGTAQLSDSIAKERIREVFSL